MHLGDAHKGRLTQGSKSVHDEIDPQQLDHSEGSLAIADGRHEGQHQRYKVDCQLELQSHSP